MSPDEARIPVLVIDDDEAIRGLLARLLPRHGYEVDLAADGDEGLGKFERKTHPIVVTDIRMPGLGVSEMVRLMAAMEPGVKILLMTGHASKPEIARAGGPCRLECLNKPFDNEELLAALRRIRGL